MSDATAHEVAAQKAAENEYELLTSSDDCTCETCVVRVVLDAAWPYLLEAAREEARTGVAVPEAFTGSTSCADDALAIKRADVDVTLLPRLGGI